MYTIIGFPGGRQVDALLLSASAERLRVLMRGTADTTEFQLIEGSWSSESGVHIELGAMIAESPADAERTLANVRPRVMTAG